MTTRSPAAATMTLLALAALTACTSGAAPDGTTGGGPPTSTPPTAEAVPTTAPRAAGGPPARCTADDLVLTLGEPTGEGQRMLVLVYTNSADRPCEAWGVPGVDLVGPDGATYSLPRVAPDDGQPRITIEPGDAASAALTYLTDTPDPTGDPGSSGWVPTQLVSTPPGDTGALTAPWPTRDAILRQDGASRPGTFVGPLGRGVSGGS